MTTETRRNEHDHADKVICPKSPISMIANLFAGSNATLSASTLEPRARHALYAPHSRGAARSSALSPRSTLARRISPRPPADGLVRDQQREAFQYRGLAPLGARGESIADVCLTPRRPTASEVRRSPRIALRPRGSAARRHRVRRALRTRARRVPPSGAGAPAAVANKRIPARHQFNKGGDKEQSSAISDAVNGNLDVDLARRVVVDGRRDIDTPFVCVDAQAYAHGWRRCKRHSCNGRGPVITPVRSCAFLDASDPWSARR